MMDAYYDAIRWLPKEISASLRNLSEQEASFVTEIRLRSDRPLCAYARQKEFIFSQNGPLSHEGEHAFVITHAWITRCFLALCRYSVHSHSRALENGYLSLPGGHRVGISGSAFYLENGHLSVQNVTSINLRVARMGIRSSSEILRHTLQSMENGVILAGEPGSGKTTLLRTAIHVLSEEGAQVAVVDERGELVPVGSEGFVFPPPFHCDVLSGYPKHIGMQHALRGLGPDVLVCDEVGSLDDIAAIKQAANAGVKLLVSIHGGNYNSLKRRPQFQALLKTGAFDQIVFLRGRMLPGEIMEVLNVADNL